MIATVVEPKVALNIAGASLVIQIIQRRLDDPTHQPRRDRVFNMLAGMRKDIIRKSGVKQIV